MATLPLFSSSSWIPPLLVILNPKKGDGLNFLHIRRMPSFCFNLQTQKLQFAKKASPVLNRFRDTGSVVYQSVSRIWTCLIWSWWFGLKLRQGTLNVPGITQYHSVPDFPVLNRLYEITTAKFLFWKSLAPANFHFCHGCLKKGHSIQKWLKLTKK
jgi:hypothetical protein